MKVINCLPIKVHSVSVMENNLVDPPVLSGLSPKVWENRSSLRSLVADQIRIVSAELVDLRVHAWIWPTNKGVGNSTQRVRSILIRLFDVNWWILLFQIEPNYTFSSILIYIWLTIGLVNVKFVSLIPNRSWIACLSLECPLRTRTIHCNWCWP